MTLRTSTLAVALLGAWPSTAAACSVCFGDPDSPQTASMNLAIWTMLGVTGFVFAGLGALIAAIALRTRRLNRPNAAGPLVESHG